MIGKNIQHCYERGLEYSIVLAAKLGLSRHEAIKVKIALGERYDCKKIQIKSLNRIPVYVKE